MNEQQHRVLEISGLVGIPYRRPQEMKDPLDGCDCWALVRLAMARPPVGINLPADPAMALSREKELGTTVWERERHGGTLAACGEMLILRGEIGMGGDPHVGVMIDPFRFIHMTMEGSRLDRLDAFERAGLVIRRIRPAIAADCIGHTPAPEPEVMP